MWQPTKLELERLDKAIRLQDRGVELYPRELSAATRSLTPSLYSWMPKLSQRRKTAATP